jgi:hypothetical protein
VKGESLRFFVPCVSTQGYTGREVVCVRLATAAGEEGEEGCSKEGERGGFWGGGGGDADGKEVEGPAVAAVAAFVDGEGEDVGGGEGGGVDADGAELFVGAGLVEGVEGSGEGGVGDAVNGGGEGVADGGELEVISTEAEGEGGEGLAGGEEGGVVEGDDLRAVDAAVEFGVAVVLCGLDGADVDLVGAGVIADGRGEGIAVGVGVGGEGGDVGGEALERGAGGGVDAGGIAEAVEVFGAVGDDGGVGGGERGDGESKCSEGRESTHGSLLTWDDWRNAESIGLMSI